MPKKPGKKWNRAHFFKREKSTRRKVGHPAYVYVTSSDDYKYLTITHKPEPGKEDEYERLKHNIDPAEDGKRSSYVKKRYGIKHRGLFENPDRPYRVHKEDVPTIKKYKK